MLLYELVRLFIVRRLRVRFRKEAIRFVRRYRIQLESARFIDQIWVRERLAMDPIVDQKVLEVAQQTGEPIPALRLKVDAYAEEISPYFSLTAYYRLGAWLAKRIVDFCFELVVDADDYEAQAARVPEGAIRVYVMNHRSNVDPVVLAYGLLHRTPLSYAVGEWALVWPLHHLFRLFGSYFVRRGESDPVYHVVLERFVQILASQGGVTGFFIEGGLSRDGKLRRPRTGLLDHIVRVRREFPDREVVFLPVGLNYDRVLEDRRLVAERDGPLPRRALHWRMLTLAGILFWFPLLVGANVVRVATRSHRKFGYAAIGFGEPLRLSEWPGGATMHLLGDEERAPALDALAEELLRRRIGAVVPAMPVPLLCLALERVGEGSRESLIDDIERLLATLRAAGTPIALGEAFEGLRTPRDHVGTTAPQGRLREEATLVFDLAIVPLLRRKVIRWLGAALGPSPGEEPIVAYYANSLRHHLED